MGLLLTRTWLTSRLWLPEFVKIKDTLVLNNLRTDLSLVRRWGPLSHESGIRTRILHSRSVLIVHSAILSFCIYLLCFNQCWHPSNFATCRPDLTLSLQIIKAKPRECFRDHLPRLRLRHNLPAQRPNRIHFPITPP